MLQVSLLLFYQCVRVCGCLCVRVCVHLCVYSGLVSVKTNKKKKKVVSVFRYQYNSIWFIFSSMNVIQTDISAHISNYISFKIKNKFELPITVTHCRILLCKAILFSHHRQKTVVQFSLKTDHRVYNYWTNKL